MGYGIVAVLLLGAFSIAACFTPTKEAEEVKVKVD